IVPAAACAAVLISLTHPGSAFAASYEQIMESCKESAGRPIVQACMQGKSGDREANREACRKTASPAVRACVIRESQRAAAGKAAPAAPKLDTGPAPKDAVAVPTTFVAPPRIIADITAILDREKPDASKIAKLKADADAAPPKTGSARDMAQFYYDRGNARALLARNKEALADGVKALEVGKCGSE